MADFNTVEGLLAGEQIRMAGRKTYKQCKIWSKRLSAALGHLRIRDLGDAHIGGYIAARVFDGAKPSTINREVGYLRTALRFRIKKGQAPQCNVRDWGHLKEKPRSRVLSVEEIKELRAELPIRQKHTMLLLLLTGMRVGELYNATRADVEWTRHGSDGDHPRIKSITVTDPKEGDAKVVVVTPTASLSAEWLYERGQQAGNAFVRKGSTPARDYELFRYHLRQAIKRLGIPRCTIHDLRRSFASHALANGATLEQVAQCLGHKTVETTRRAYARLDQGARARVASVVEGVF